MEMDTDGSTATRTTGAGSAEGSIDLVWGSGLFGVDSNGKTVTVTCRMRIEFAPTGTSSWQTLSAGTLSFPGASFASDGTIQVTNGERKTVRVGVQWAFPAVDQYDIRVTRVSTDWGGATTDNQLGNLAWTVLRTIRNEPVSTTGTKKIAIRIKATDQLSGNIDQFNCVLSQPVPVYDSSTQTWTTQPSSNPAWIYRWIARDSPANPRRVKPERVDDVELIDWAAECDANGFTYNGCLDQPTTLMPLLKDVCNAGRAAFGTRDGKYTAVRDLPQSVPVQVFTPRNSWGFSGSRAFPDAVHALRVQFINPQASWQQDERIVYDDGYGDEAMVAADPTLQLATQFEQLNIPGCTDPDMAWKLGRYHLAVGRLRPNLYTWNADIEHMVCSRGDLVLFAHDVIGVGKAYARIKTIEADGNGAAIALRLDEECILTAGTAYSIRVRRRDASVAVIGVSADLYGSPVTYLHLTAPSSGLNEDDLVLFGESDQEALSLLITRIDPAAEMSAKLTAVDAAPAVLQAAAGTVPAWNSTITGQPFKEPPAEPSVVLVSSDQALAQINDSGVTTPSMLITVAGPWSGFDSTAQIGG